MGEAPGVGELLETQNWLYRTGESSSWDEILHRPQRPHKDKNSGVWDRARVPGVKPWGGGAC